jgi:hypothetical protein
VDVTGAVTAVSWIPSEAVEGLPRVPFDLGVLHYDDPPPERLVAWQDVEALWRQDRLRCGHRLSGRAFVESGVIVDARYDHSSRGVLGGTTVRMARASTRFLGVELPCLRHPPQITPDAAVLSQTFGGRTAVPAPRRVRSRRHVRLVAPTVWTTLVLRLGADGAVDCRLHGASPFPRHWLYDDTGSLVAKTGLADFDSWYRDDRSETPWGDEESPALVTAAETALERTLAVEVMRSGTSPDIVVVPAGQTVVRQGERDDTLYLLLDGVVAVEVDGQQLVELGPGALLGERAVLEGGHRTATVRAVTRVRLAAVPPERLDRAALADLSGRHRREDQQHG